MRRLFRKRRGHPLGVTLVELIVTIAVIAILVTLAAPAMLQSQQRAQARSLSNEIAQQIRAARNRAMSRNEAVWVDFTLGTDAANRGSLTFRRTKPMCADGTFVSPCADGSTPTRARNCRMAPAATSDYDTISVADFNRESGNAMLTAVDPSVPGICISADGSIFDEDGVIISGGSVPCVGENLVLLVTDASVAAGTAKTVGTCGTPPQERELIDLFVIRVPFNGSAEVKQ